MTGVQTCALPIYDDLFSLVLTLFSIFMAPNNLVERLPLFGTNKLTSQEFWRTRLPPLWLTLVEELAVRVDPTEEPDYDGLLSTLMDDLLPERSIYADDSRA